MGTCTHLQDSPHADWCLHQYHDFLHWFSMESLQHEGKHNGDDSSGLLRSDCRRYPVRSEGHAPVEVFGVNANVRPRIAVPVGNTMVDLPMHGPLGAPYARFMSRRP